MCLAVPGKIVSIEGADPILRSGKVSFGGILKTINLAYVPEANLGDYVLVHVGFAISVVDEAEAQQVFEYLRQMGELAELEETKPDEVR
jgi:hydrogenase expression/formation protein HypC